MEIVDVVAKHGLFVQDERLCIPEGADYSAICDDFDEAGCPVTIIADEVDYIVPDSLLPDDWLEGDYDDDID